MEGGAGFHGRSLWMRPRNAPGARRPSIPVTAFAVSD